MSATKTSQRGINIVLAPENDVHPPTRSSEQKVPKADEGAALGRSSLGKRPSPALRVSLSPQEDAGRGTLDRKDALVAAMPRGDSRNPLIRLRHLLPRKKRGGEGLSIGDPGLSTSRRKG